MTLEKALLEAIVSNVNQAITVVDASGKFVFANDGAAKVLGFSSAAELIAADPHSIAERYQLVDEKHQRLEPARLPTLRAFQGETPPEMVVGWRSAPGAELRWSVLRAVPLKDEQGRLQAVLSFFTEITERKRREAERDDFIALLGHELRNPLAPLVNSVHLIRKSGPSDRLLEIMERQLGQLDRLVDDLLDSARVSHGAVQLQREVLELGDFVEDAAHDHAGLFRERGIELDIDCDSGVHVSGDRVRLGQIAGNLLGNALEFTPRGGRVTVTVRRAGAQAELTVADSGEGLTAEELGRLFQPFTRATHGGLGLGLSVVRGLVGLHGGQVTASSGGKGRGSTFVVTLPEVPAPAVRKVAPAPAASSLKPMTVLIVDDNVNLAHTMRDLLRFVVSRVEVEHSGAAAVDTIRRVKPDVVICDIGLPDKDGYAIAREVRSDDGLKHIGLVAVSGYGLETDRQRAVDAGFSRHITKPVPPDVLIQLFDDN